MDSNCQQTIGRYEGDMVFPSLNALHSSSVETPKGVVEEVASDSINRFHTKVTINGQGPYYVGDTASGRKQKETSHWLYHDPTDPENNALAGKLVSTYTLTDGYQSEKSYSVGFEPAGDCNGIHAVTTLTVTRHNRSEQLNNLLPDIRTALTERDWHENDKPRPPKHRDVISGAVTLADHASDIADEVQFVCSPVPFLNEPACDSLLKYNHESTDILIQIGSVTDRTSKWDRSDVSPEAVRELLFHFANAEL
jgi:hypothetical protein